MTAPPGPGRVAVAVTSDVYGGAEKCLIELYGHPRLRAAFRGTLVGAMPGWERTGLAERSMGPARKWGRGAAAGELRGLPGARARGRRALAAGGPDLIHLSYKREQILLTRTAADIAPVLWTEHGALPRGRRWRALEAAYRRAARRAAGIICVAPHVADDVSAAVGRGCPPLHVIENAIDISGIAVPDADEVRRARARLGLPADGLVVASTSRLSEGKRVGLVLDAVRHLPGAVAVICGDGPERERIRARADARTVVTGFMPDPTDVYRAADVLVHPTSGAGEGLPFSMIEAAATGVPVVVCADSGLGGVVAGWGAVARRPDGGSIADAVRSLGADDRRAAREWAERHALDASIDAHLAVMRDAHRPVTTTDGSGGAIRARGLVKAFGAVPVLQGVDLDVGPGRVVALLGPNGAGKSTLIRILSTLVIPDAGEATVAGVDVVADPRGARRGIGLVVGDERSWYWRLSARDNLVFFGVLDGLDRRAAAVRGTGLMETFGLPDVGRQRVGTFSAGMRGRLGLARALLADPPILILDEPTRSIDPVGSEEFRVRVRSLADDGKAILLATHDLEEAATTADEVVVLVGGRVGARVPGGSVERIRAAVRAAADG